MLDWLGSLLTLEPKAAVWTAVVGVVFYGLGWINRGKEERDGVRRNRPHR